MLAKIKKVYTNCNHMHRAFPLQLFAFWVILHAILSSADFFSKSIFSKKSFRNTIRVASNLDPDEDSVVEPDLGPNCL